MQFFNTLLRFHAGVEYIRAVFCQVTIRRFELLRVNNFVQRDAANVLHELTDEIVIYFVARRVVCHGIRGANIAHLSCLDIRLNTIAERIFRDRLVA